ncbi:MAG: hypothetical protein ACI4C4_07135 [Lachnospiraceae bacterium]
MKKNIIYIVIGGVIMFSFTACGKQDVAPTMSTTIETTVETETEEPGVVAGGLYNENSELGTGNTETVITEEYTVTFENASNEKITAKDGETVVIPKFERQKIKDIIAEVFDNFDSEDTENYNILETTENDDGSTTYVVSLASDALTENAVTQYSSDDNGNVKALFVYQSALETTPDQLALKFEITKKDDKSVTLDKIYDLFGNDVSDITLYNGDCIGWSLTKFANEVDFEFLDEIHLSQDLTLYPVMDSTNAAEQGEDLTVGTWMRIYNGQTVKLGDTFEGKNIGYSIKEGKVISIDTSKEVDPETGELKEVTKQETNKKETQTNKGNTDNNGKTNNGEQSSITGGQGNSQTSGAPGGNANVPDEPSGGMNPEEAFGKFGAEFIGSGLDTSGFDHGDGGYGVIHE